MSDPGPGPDPGAGDGAGLDGAQALDPQQLGAYFVLMEAVSLLQHQVEQQLRAEGDLSYVQFQLLARLAHTPGPLSRAGHALAHMPSIMAVPDPPCTIPPCRPRARRGGASWLTPRRTLPG